MKQLCVTLFLASLFLSLASTVTNRVIQFQLRFTQTCLTVTKEGGVGKGLRTNDITLRRDATSKTDKQLSRKSWHSKFHHSYLLQGTGF